MVKIVYPIMAIEATTLARAINLSIGEKDI
jgi:hypothetical protein